MGLLLKWERTHLRGPAPAQDTEPEDLQDSVAVDSAELKAGRVPPGPRCLPRRGALSVGDPPV